jgi:hypothetical protein
MSSYKSFIHFGCWNYNMCDSSHLAEPVKQEDTNVTRVMKTIKKYIEISIEKNKNKPEFLTVSGDNYYFVKNKKEGVDEDEKIFSPEFLLSGFNCLPKDIKKYVLIGNHDLENIENPLKDPDCSILEIQQDFASDGTNNMVLDSDRKGPIMHHVVDESTIVIMLDTTMYETSEKSIKKVMKCYQRMFEMNEMDVPENVVLEKIKVMRENQKQRLADYISSLKVNAERIKNIIVVGHHPLFDLKTKKDDATEKLKTKEEVMPLLNELYYESIYAPLQEVNSGINYFYLCADLHQYQTGIVTIQSQSSSEIAPLVIHQYIVGTGGTALEKKPYDHSKDEGASLTNEKYMINYDIIPNDTEYTHGFLVCKLDTDKNFSAEFIPADSPESVGGTSYKKKGKTMKKRTMKKRAMKKRTMKRAIRKAIRKVKRFTKKLLKHKKGLKHKRSKKIRRKY